MTDETSAIVDATTDRDDAVGVAAEALRDGRLVVVPTDTVYGVTADAFNPVATAAVFAAKHRQRRFPLPVLIRSPKQLMGLVTEVPEMAELLMAAYWPGPLTLVVQADPNLAWDLGTNEGTVAVRMPMDEITLDLIRAVGPLAMTSANLSGNPAATTVEMAQSQLGDDVAVYVDGGRRVETAPSTIVDLTRAEPAILRSGPFDDDEVLAVARGEVEPHQASTPSPRHKPVSPGGPAEVMPDAATEPGPGDERGDEQAGEAGDDVSAGTAAAAASTAVAIDHRAAASSSSSGSRRATRRRGSVSTPPAAVPGPTSPDASEDSSDEPMGQDEDATSDAPREPSPATTPTRRRTTHHVARDHRAG